ncbi:hypothetical protein [Neisseria sp.]
MKNIKTQLFAVLIGLSAAAAPAAETAQGTGKVFEDENYMSSAKPCPKAGKFPATTTPATPCWLPKPKAARYFCLMAEKGRN